MASLEGEFRLQAFFRSDIFFTTTSLADTLVAWATKKSSPIFKQAILGMLEVMILKEAEFEAGITVIIEFLFEEYQGVMIVFPMTYDFGAIVAATSVSSEV